jgi:hypothetical protein
LNKPQQKKVFASFLKKKRLFSLFFFEKKNQETFATLGARRTAGGYAFGYDGGSATR